MTYVTPNDHEKAEWSRLAQHAYAYNQNAIGHRYSMAAALYRGGPMAVYIFDALQAGYREWLVRGSLMAALQATKVNAR